VGEKRRKRKSDRGSGKAVSRETLLKVNGDEGAERVRALKILQTLPTEGGGGENFRKEGGSHRSRTNKNKNQPRSKGEKKDHWLGTAGGSITNPNVKHEKAFCKKKKKR